MSDGVIVGFSGAPGMSGSFSGIYRIEAYLPPTDLIAGIPVPALGAIGRGTLIALLIGAVGGAALARRRPDGFAAR